MCRDALPSAIVLFDSALEIAPGVKIFGTPWTGCEFPLDGPGVVPSIIFPSHLMSLPNYVLSSWCGGWARPEMEAAFSAIPTDTTILMTHNPPFNILDLVCVPRIPLQPCLPHVPDWAMLWLCCMLFDPVLLLHLPCTDRAVVWLHHICVCCSNTCPCTML